MLPKIVILARDSVASRALYWDLSKKFTVEYVFLEKKSNRLQFIIRRLKKNNIFTVFGQTLFMLLVLKIVKLFSNNRLNEIINKYQLKIDQIPKHKVFKTKSINEKTVFKKISEINPDLILVNGTRIISVDNLNSLKCKIINLHLGITPNYRGSHGGYWSIRNNELNCFGSTFHFIDSGIDTGKIILQIYTKFNSSDTIATYPLLLFASSLEHYEKLIWELYCNKLELKENKVQMGKLYYNPTVFDYLWHLFVYGIK